MAEAGTRYVKKEQLEPYSAEVEPEDVDQRATKAMAEVGIDISAKESKDIAALRDLEFDYVITLCDHAHEACPFYPAKARVEHRSFDNPPKLATSAKNEEEAMAHYRWVRDVQSVRPPKKTSKRRLLKVA